MSAKFTPGKWEIKSRHNGLCFRVVCDEGDPEGPAEICQTGGWIAEAKIEELANAHLIAAAPDLYAALEVLLADYEQGAMSGDWGNWDWENQPELVAARAALAKARGEPVHAPPSPGKAG